MKKYLFIAATAIAALASCSSEDAIEQVSQNTDAPDAVVFDAYAGRTSRATALTLDAIKADGVGFGVYAYQQGKKDINNYLLNNTVPDFFYNQQIKWNSTTNKWEYDPIKYWSNNIGALHSFFAYAPYNANINSVFTADGPVVRYSATDNYDLLVAAPHKNLTKPGVAEQIKFQFAHALSQVKFQVVPFVDEVHGTHGAGTNTLDTKTKINVRSIKLVGKVPSKGIYNLLTEAWTSEAIEEGAYEIIDSKSLTNSTTDYVDYGVPTMVIPTQLGQKCKVQIVYDVVTEDATNPQNNSTITNVITSTEEFELVKGTSYLFKLDLGMTTVKFDADVTAWSSDQNVNVDLPNNKYPGLTQVNYTSAATAPASPAAGDYYYNTTDDAYYYCTTAGTWDTTPLTTSVIYYNESNGKYYQDAACTNPATITQGNYYLINNILYKAN